MHHRFFIAIATLFAGSGLALGQNDECTGAITVPAGTYPFTNVGSTASGQGFWCGSHGGGSDHDIWFRYIAPVTGPVVVETCGSPFDTMLEVYRGTCANLQSLGCDDDTCGLQSRVSFQATAGLPYFINVGGFWSATGSGILTIVDNSPPTVGSTYCAAEANSTGTHATLSAFGSGAAVDNDLTLSAHNLPQDEFGSFMTSQAQGFTPTPGGSQGNLCLGGSIGRYRYVFSSGATGTGRQELDLTATPTPTGPVAIVQGETWNFQCWYRDRNPGTTSNFTTGLSVTFS